MYRELVALKDRIDDFNASASCEVEKENDLRAEVFSFQVEMRTITKQLPKKEYLEILRRSNQDEEETYLCDRLMNGIPVFLPGEDSNVNRPLLIVERPESVLSKNYDLKYLKIRRYSVD